MSRLTPLERFLSKVDKKGSDECWPWLASKSPGGYGMFYLNKKLTNASRVAYQLLVGPVPEGMYVLHSCDNPPCCNPAHLRVGTALDNSADMIARGKYVIPISSSIPLDKVVEARRLHKQEGLSVAAIAKRLGLCWDTVDNYIKGKRRLKGF